MQHTIDSLTGFKMNATDGEIGEVKEFYFDDETWDIRHVIVETGGWLSSRKVLIAPQALLSPDWENKNFPVNLTQEQIKTSPLIDTDKPVSKRQLIDMYGHYAWQPYGLSSFYASGATALVNLPPVMPEQNLRDTNPDDNPDNQDPHLRSTDAVSGYYIHATDGDIGHVKDFFVDDATWTITALLMDTHNLIGGKKVLIPIRHITKIKWLDNKVFVDLSTEAIKNLAAYDKHG